MLDVIFWILIWFAFVIVFLIVLGLAKAQRDIEYRMETVLTALAGHSLRIKEVEEAIGKPSDHSKPVTGPIN